METRGRHQVGLSISDVVDHMTGPAVHSPMARPSPDVPLLFQQVAPPRPWRWRLFTGFPLDAMYRQSSARRPADVHQGGHDSLSMIVACAPASSVNLGVAQGRSGRDRHDRRSTTMTGPTTSARPSSP